jgi:hypothetical protein
VRRGPQAEEDDDDPFIETVDAERLELWVEEMCVPLLGNFIGGEPRSTVVMDNASSHQSDRVRELIRQAGATLNHVAPYSRIEPS